MANNTAEEWRTAAEELKAQREAASAEQAAATARINEIGKLIVQAGQADNIDLAVALQTERKALRVQIGELGRKYEDLARQETNAESEAAKAGASPPNTSTVPPPTSASPAGSTNTAPAGEKVNTGDTDVPTGSDSSVVVGGPNPESNIKAQPLDNGEDPYVSNGESTVDSIVSSPEAQPDTITQEESYTPLQEPPGTQDEFSGIDQQVENNENALQEPPDVDPDEDPMQAALDANRTEDTEGPTEQAVIDATDDPQLTKEDNAALEAEQAANRAALAQEEVTGGFEVKSVNAVREKAVQAVQRQARQQEDWRVRLQLAQSATYLYNDPSCKQGDLLYPLKATNGVIFPYTPAISSSYRANYDPTELVHTNYKQYFYKNSSVDELSIQADFTAQDTTEALYMLAVIHFFKSVTKMFYGKDTNPRAGTPPPLCYLSGYGQYQYSDHPLLVTSFAYNLPNDVDYIRAGSTTQWAGQNVGSYGNAPAASSKGFSLSSLFRLGSSKLNKGGVSKAPEFSQLSNSQATYVPTKLSIQLGLVPVVTRYDIANNFSVKDYATGKLLKGGIW